MKEMIMTTVERQRAKSLFPEIADFFAGFPSWPSLRPMFDTNLMRLEDELTDDKYMVRAEIPGVDPDKDIEITVQDGRLTIRAERQEKKETNGRSEFNYGSFVRTVSLPSSADEENITADYDKGILTVSVPLRETQPSPKRIEVKAGT
jgi:HSP20 family molecular chaperone IbpA